MKIDPFVRRRMIRNAALSLFIYALPVLLMLGWFSLRHSKPWERAQAVSALHQAAPNRFHGYGFVVFIIALGLVEFSLGLYRKEWTRNEKALDLACFALPKLVFAPFFAWFSLTVLPRLLPHQLNLFRWVPFCGAYSFSALQMT
jgi:hypothetical protein